VRAVEVTKARVSQVVTTGTIQTYQRVRNYRAINTLRNIGAINTLRNIGAFSFTSFRSIYENVFGIAFCTICRIQAFRASFRTGAARLV